MFWLAPWLGTTSPKTFKEEAVLIFLIKSSSKFSKSMTICKLLGVEPSFKAMNLLERKALTHP